MRSQKGITFYELLIALILAAILAMFALPMFGKAGIDCDSPDARQNPIMRAKIAGVIGDLGEIHMAIGRFELSNERYPTSLAEIGFADMKDPWGNPYRYLVVYQLEENGPKRKDHDLIPINRYYDLYSSGPDGKTATPTTSTTGGDDVIMANDGDYFGVACQYDGSGKN